MRNERWARSILRSLTSYSTNEESTGERIARTLRFVVAACRAVDLDPRALLERAIEHVDRIGIVPYVEPNVHIPSDEHRNAWWISRKLGWIGADAPVEEIPEAAVRAALVASELRLSSMTPEGWIDQIAFAALLRAEPNHEGALRTAHASGGEEAPRAYLKSVGAWTTRWEPPPKEMLP